MHALGDSRIDPVTEIVVPSRPIRRLGDQGSGELSHAFSNNSSLRSLCTDLAWNVDS